MFTLWQARARHRFARRSVRGNFAVVCLVRSRSAPLRAGFALERIGTLRAPALAENEPIVVARSLYALGDWIWRYARRIFGDVVPVVRPAALFCSHALAL